jgi:UDP-N-acetylglucosamine--dolichyl-phosphate N-acetylglucosaminephosphotransferase
MNNFWLLMIIVIGFLTTLLATPFWIRKAKQLGLVWENMNTTSSEKVPGSGGITVLLGFLFGALLFIQYQVFIVDESSSLIQIMALLLVIGIATGIGLMDDLFGWRRGGLSMRSRMLLVAFASIPLVAINAGTSSIILPIIGAIELGVIYPLFLIPLGVVGATTTYNFLAGSNGLEAGQGILIISALSIVAYQLEVYWLSFLGILMIFPLIAFLLYNIYPAKIFPGDVLTYAVGSLIATMSILGNFERIAVFFFIPVILETILKIRGNLKKHSFGKPNKDGSLDLMYDKIYSLNHLAIYLMKKWKIKPTEPMVTISIWIFQFIIIILGFIIFRNGIFL